MGCFPSLLCCGPKASKKKGADAMLQPNYYNRRVDLKDRGAAEGRTSPDDKTASMAEHQDGLKYKFKRKKRCASIAEQTLPTILE